MDKKLSWLAGIIKSVPVETTRFLSALADKDIVRAGKQLPELAEMTNRLN